MSVYFPYLYKEASAPVKIVTWADGTPAEIAAMLAAADAGKINLSDYWSIGDERTEHLSAIAANPNGAFTAAMAAQDVVMVLMNEGYMNQQGIHYVVGQKGILNQNGRWNASNTNTGSWKDSLMRADLNNLYYNAFDSDFKALFKPFNVLTAQTYNGSTNETTQDYIALFAEKEIIGFAHYSNTTEAGALSQIKYYETSSNRAKKSGAGTITNWAERSPTLDYAGAFCIVSWQGSEIYSAASKAQGISPFGCI